MFFVRHKCWNIFTFSCRCVWRTCMRKILSEHPPSTTPYVPKPTRPSRLKHEFGGIRHSPIDDIIEEAVEHDIQSELGNKLNITLVGSWTPGFNLASIVARESFLWSWIVSDSGYRSGYNYRSWRTISDFLCSQSGTPPTSFLSFQIKNNAKAQNLIHNATEEIKNLLNINEDMEKEFANGTAKLKITRKMQGASSQVSW